MSESANQRSEEFLKISGQFKLGELITEASHPVTAQLNEVAKRDPAAALDLLFQVDGDAVKKFQEFADSGRAQAIKTTLLQALKNGGRIFFTGCGSTGRLSILLVSIWRDFWQQQKMKPPTPSGGKGVAEDRTRGTCEDLEHRAFSVMAGGDFALIKSVEGFEDFAEFGQKQLGDLGVSNRDVVFAITEGGETSFVIGTAWQGVAAGAKVYFVYNNPDEILCRQVERSREVIQDARIEKINLTTGPMAVTGSTRMQATSIQLCALVTVLEMVVRELTSAAEAAQVPAQFSHGLAQLLLNLRGAEFRNQLAALVALEESVYRSGHKNNYYADRLGIDVLTDTTERSPTYCTPPFRKFDDAAASESWAFLFVPAAASEPAWRKILKREPDCVAWGDDTIRRLVGGDKFERTREVVRKIGRAELLRFRIGQDGLAQRPLQAGDSAVAVLAGAERNLLNGPDGFMVHELAAAQATGARTGLLCFGGPFAEVRELISSIGLNGVSVFVPVPPDEFLLKGVTRVAVKLVLNALSTCTMVRLGRVMGNTMIWVVASNLKLIDRATRYIEKLTGLGYAEANRLLFETIEYVEPRLKADQAYPPVVGLAVLRARHGISNEAAEEKLLAEWAR